MMRLVLMGIFWAWAMIFLAIVCTVSWSLWGANRAWRRDRRAAREWHRMQARGLFAQHLIQVNERRRKLTELEATDYHWSRNPGSRATFLRRRSYNGRDL